MTASDSRVTLDARLAALIAQALVRAIRAEDEKIPTSTSVSTNTTSSSRPAA
jgi:hypothetical protein